MTGAEERDAVMAAFEARAMEFLDQARTFAAHRARLAGAVSINDVRACVPVPQDIHPNVLGAVFRTNQFQPIGWEQAVHRSAHARAVRVYKLKEH
jgi:hypothetical protein